MRSPEPFPPRGDDERIPRRDVGLRGARAEAVRSAVASAHLAGVIPSQETLAVFEDYVSGAIDADGMVDRVLRMYGPDAQPIPLPAQPVR